MEIYAKKYNTAEEISKSTKVKREIGKSKFNK